MQAAESLQGEKITCLPRNSVQNMGILVLKLHSTVLIQIFTDITGPSNLVYLHFVLCWNTPTKFGGRAPLFTILTYLSSIIACFSDFTTFLQML